MGGKQESFKLVGLLCCRFWMQRLQAYSSVHGRGLVQSKSPITENYTNTSTRRISCRGGITFYLALSDWPLRSKRGKLSDILKSNLASLVRLPVAHAETFMSKTPFERRKDWRTSTLSECGVRILSSSAQKDASSFRFV